MLPPSMMLQGQTFEKSRPGIYIDTAVTVGSPANEIRFRSNPRSRGAKLSFSATRIHGRFNAPDTNPNRKIEQGVWTLSYSGPNTATISPAVLEHVINDIRLALTQAVIRDLILGSN